MKLLLWMLSTAERSEKVYVNKVYLNKVYVNKVYVNKSSTCDCDSQREQLAKQNAVNGHVKPAAHPYMCYDSVDVGLVRGTALCWQLQRVY